jgi:hypothetical protein
LKAAGGTPFSARAFGGLGGLHQTIARQVSSYSCSIFVQPVGLDLI